MSHISHTFMTCGATFRHTLINCVSDRKQPVDTSMFSSDMGILSHASRRQWQVLIGRAYFHCGGANSLHLVETELLWHGTNWVFLWYQLNVSSVSNGFICLFWFHTGDIKVTLADYLFFTTKTKIGSDSNLWFISASYGYLYLHNHTTRVKTLMYTLQTSNGSFSKQSRRSCKSCGHWYSISLLIEGFPQDNGKKPFLKNYSCQGSGGDDAGLEEDGTGILRCWTTCLRHSSPLEHMTHNSSHHPRHIVLIRCHWTKVNLSLSWGYEK